MPRDFYSRLRCYYLDVAKALRGDADAASIFPNSSDIGSSREQVYAKFLEEHTPSKCNVFFGGFLFDEGGTESKQLDVIVTTDTAPRFVLTGGKGFSPVEGTIAAISIKSRLHSSELYDALSGFSSIPAMQPLERRVQFGMRIRKYDDWPLRILYATSGMSWQNTTSSLKAFLHEKNIPRTRWPHLIHVLEPNRKLW